MLKESDILYESGDFWVCRARKTKGYEVYENGITHSTRVAQIGQSGEEGLTRAKNEADRRHASKLFKSLQK